MLDSIREREKKRNQPFRTVKHNNETPKRIKKVLGNIALLMVLFLVIVTIIAGVLTWYLA